MILIRIGNREFHELYACPECDYLYSYPKYLCGKCNFSRTFSRRKCESVLVVKMIKAGSHQELIDRAKKWLISRKKCWFVLTDFHSSITETPDAVGWKRGVSILIEVKTSRKDLFSEYKGNHRKQFRQFPKDGIGLRRYYLVPKGLIRPNELPDSNWGLLYAYPKIIKIIKESENFERSKVNEISILSSALRREKFKTKTNGPLK